MTLLGWLVTRKMKATLGIWLKDILKEVLQGQETSYGITHRLSH